MYRRSILAAVLAALAAVAVTWWAFRSSISHHRVTSQSARSVEVQALRPKVEAFCGDCHSTPEPDTFPRAAWRREVAQGFRFYAASGRSDLIPPNMGEVIAYYEQLAPAELAWPSSPDRSSPDRSFRPATLSLPDAPRVAAVSSLFWGSGPSGEQRLTFCDMYGGGIWSCLPAGAHGDAEVIGVVQNPARLAPCDLNGDDITDFVAADLGSFTPADHGRGAVVWLNPAAEDAEPVVLQSDLGRVADVRPADFDGDGDQDLIVAEFGWRRTGRVLCLEHQGVSEGLPQFDLRVLDDRHGAIHVPAGDMNGDGALDVVVLLSQEHEQVICLVNDGQGGFENRTIFEAGDPAFGSSGIELVDLDQDGDLDVLYTNGDTLDSYDLKPTHGVHWFENRGEFPFAAHRIATLPGAMRALPGDLDGDEDLDVVVAAYIPASLRRQPTARVTDTLMALEQTEPGIFTGISLDGALPGYMALELADFDGDGDLDIAGGTFDTSAEAAGNWLRIWWNDALAD